MSTFIETSVFFGVVVSLLAYGIGMLLKQRFHLGVFNPLLISIVITIGVLLLCHIDYNTYNEGAKYLSYLLTPATVALAIPLYDQLAVLKKNWKAILAGIASGVLVLLFGLSHEEYVTLLPKSITTAIGIGISEELGGYVSITAAVIIITGVLGNVIGETILKLFRITEPVAKGVALGSASHAIGTAKAMELGEIEGAISSLSIVVSGIMTVIGASLFAGII